MLGTLHERSARSAQLDHRAATSHDDVILGLARRRRLPSRLRHQFGMSFTSQRPFRQITCCPTQGHPLIRQTLLVLSAPGSQWSVGSDRGPTANYFKDCLLKQILGRLVSHDLPYGEARSSTKFSRLDLPQALSGRIR